MEGGGSPRARRVNPVMRDAEEVTPLELFFDLVFVLALTQCTALMADQPTWEGLGRGLLILGLLWWAWVGYAWLTSVVNPEEGAVRLAIFAAMAGLLVVSLCVPDAFVDLGLEFAIAYGTVRAGQIMLFWISSRDDAKLRKSVRGLGMSTALGVGLLIVGALLEPTGQAIVWSIALALDVAGPYFFGSAGWRLMPEHFAERHGLIIIIALGESIVAIGVGSQAGVTAGVAAAAVLGIALAASMWWAYFDVVAVVARRHLSGLTDRRERNEVARDSYSLLHFPMVAGIVLVALGMKKTIEHVDDPLKLVPAVALIGGYGIYLLAHVAFRLRNVQSINRRRLGLGIGIFALIPLATEIPAIATLAIVTAISCALIAYEVIRYAEHRDRVRHADA